MLLLIGAALACAPEPALAHRAELYLGANRDGKPYVGPIRWGRFVREVLTPAFPGFTVIEGRGYWEGAAEKSRVVVILHAEADEARLAEVAEAYRARFGQEATLIVDQPVTTTTCAAG